MLKLRIGTHARMIVHELMQTGPKSVDTIATIDREKHDLIFGYCQTGKTAVACDIFLNQTIDFHSGDVEMRNYGVTSQLT